VKGGCSCERAHCVAFQLCSHYRLAAFALCNFDHRISTKPHSTPQSHQQQAFYEARRAKQQQSQARLLSALYPTREDKQRRQAELKAEEDAFVAARAAEK